MFWLFPLSEPTPLADGLIEKTRDTVLKTLLKTSDKKSQIHSDLKGMEISPPPPRSSL